MHQLQVQIISPSLNSSFMRLFSRKGKIASERKKFMWFSLDNVLTNLQYQLTVFSIILLEVGKSSFWFIFCWSPFISNIYGFLTFVSGTHFLEFSKCSAGNMKIVTSCTRINGFNEIYSVRLCRNLFFCYILSWLKLKYSGNIFETLTELGFIIFLAKSDVIFPRNSSIQKQII